MSQSGLMEVELATIEWQETTQKNQQITANTTNEAAAFLMALYNHAESALDAWMKVVNGYDSSSKTYSTKVNIWETKYNQCSQEWQNKENSWNTPIQSLDTHEQSLGNASQEASQIAGTMAKPLSVTANLLQSNL